VYSRRRLELVVEEQGSGGNNGAVKTHGLKLLELRLSVQENIDHCGLDVVSSPPQARMVTPMVESRLSISTTDWGIA
jgi:hypothetical protein